MQTEKVESQLPGQNPEFVHIPKAVFDTAICELLGLSTTCFRLDDLIGEAVAGGPLMTVLELLGYGEYGSTDQFKTNVFQIVDYHANKIKDPITQVNPKKVGKKIFKEIKVEIEKFNRNPHRYA